MASKPRLKLVRLPKPKVKNADNFIESLVWALDKARQGKVKTFVMVFTVEAEDGPMDIEIASQDDDTNPHHVLGMIRHMEHRFMRREWPHDFE